MSSSEGYSKIIINPKQKGGIGSLIRYTLFGKPNESTQGAMMAHVFQELLSRHHDLIPAALEQFSCLLDTDFEQEPDKLRKVPSAFLNRRVIFVENRPLTIGTSYSFKDKRRLISRLFQLCEEDETQFAILSQGEVAEGTAITKMPPKRTVGKKITYQLFGKVCTDTQAGMMYHVFEEVLSRTPGLAEWAVEHLACVSRADDPRWKEGKENPPAGFRSLRTIRTEVGDLCVGSAYNLKAKQRWIDRLCHQAGLPRDIFYIFGSLKVPALRPEQYAAAKAAVSALHKGGGADGRLGLLCLAVGTGKEAVIREIAQALVCDVENAWSVVILTTTAALAAQYYERLSQEIGTTCSVELAKTVPMLSEKAGIPRTVLISTAQKLLVKKARNTIWAEDNSKLAFSESSRLLVIVEEASYHYFGQTAQDLWIRFPKAKILGITVDCEPSPSLMNRFGPIQFRYSYREAYHDGHLREVIYQRIGEKIPDEEIGSNYVDLDQRIRAISQWIAGEEEQARGCSLLLCTNQMDAALFYGYLVSYLSPEQVKTCLTQPLTGAFRNPAPPPESRWNGTLSSGVVIAVSADRSEVGGAIFDTVYWDQSVNRLNILNVLSTLARPSAYREKPGRFVDLRNDWERISRYVPEGFPLYQDEPQSESEEEQLKPLLRWLSHAMGRRQYGEVRSILSHLQSKSLEVGERVTEQLAFLFPPQLQKEKQQRYWSQHERTLDWKSSLWCLLSQDSTCAWSAPEIYNEPETDTQEPEETEHPTSVPVSETSQALGARLEQATKQMIRELFSLEDESCLEQLRTQHSGNQFGFDLTFTYMDAFRAPVTCMIECKNYTSRQIQLKDVAEKLASVQAEGLEVDHWILISPIATLSNDLWRLLPKWRERDTWEPIRDVQFWTPDEEVQKLFALFPELYEQFYQGQAPEPSGEEERKQCLTRWKDKLRPVPHLPAEWKRYLRTPVQLLTQQEADLNTVREYELLYQMRAPIRLLDEGELLIDGPAEERILQWLRDSEHPNALLLGDFGDGKSFFTYVLARKLAEDFLRSPKSGWIPLRLSLREQGDRRENFRDFLNRRLQEFCDGVSSWNAVQRENRILIILDGLDEMSLSMNDTAILRNVAVLEKILEQFRGHKILLTSRKMIMYSDRVCKRVLDVLEQPEILHLAPITRGDRLAFLERYADTPERKARLMTIRRTHDLLGLASKPLFLNMMRIQLESDDIQAMDMAGIYQNYAEQSLKRKYNVQLVRAEEDITDPETVRQRLLKLLEDLALCLQRAGEDSISLEAFKAQIQQKDLAGLLWDSTCDAPEISEDAEKRLSSRSLLKYDCRHPENRCFCHRSMKEYFVACGLVRNLVENETQVRALLMECDFSYEILEFAGNGLKKLSEQQQTLAVERLCAFAHESQNAWDAPDRKPLENLAANSVNLLYYGGFGLPGQDWSGLLLDHVRLSGLDLSGKNLSHSSMRRAHMENADLTDCDLRGCDFTQVQFERSGQLDSFAVASGDGVLLAHYKDGKLRRWNVPSGETRILAQFPSEISCQLLLKGENREALLMQETLQFIQRGSQEFSLVGAVSLGKDLRVLDVVESAVLVRKGPWLYLLNMPEGTILYQRELAGVCHAALLSERLLVLWTEEYGLEILALLPNSQPRLTKIRQDSPVTGLGATMVSETEGLLALGGKNGRLQVLRLSTDGGGHWDCVPVGHPVDCGEPITELTLDRTGELYVGTFAGSIIRYWLSETGMPKETQRFRLELKCAGALIEGVRPKEQFERLRLAVEETVVSRA